ncbi:MAG: four helix bundle protein [Planctomycetia bacterium]|nr:four helix bundle protein [Planctomycetia bacterium]
MARDVSYEKAYSLALRIVQLCRTLREEKREYVLSNQLLRCGTSIGANLAEAHASISPADLSSKVSIAFKECKETRYWISLLRDSDYLGHEDAQAVLDELAKILFSIIRTLRIRNPSKN